MNGADSVFPDDGPGLSKRDYIAIQVLCAAIANPGSYAPWNDMTFLPRVAYEQADAMIKQSQQQPKPE